MFTFDVLLHFIDSDLRHMNIMKTEDGRGNNEMEMETEDRRTKKERKKHGSNMKFETDEEPRAACRTTHSFSRSYLHSITILHNTLFPTLVMFSLNPTAAVRVF
jgi:hypothetical protein